MILNVAYPLDPLSLQVWWQSLRMRAVQQRWAWTGSGLDILQDTCDFFCIRIGFGYLFLKKTGSEQDQDICLISMTKFSWEWLKVSQMMVLLFSLLWFLYSQKIKIILSVCAHCAALIIIDDNSCYFIVNIFRRGGSSKRLLYCWYAALFCCAEWHVCALYRLIYCSVFHGWPTSLRLGSTRKFLDNLRSTSWSYSHKYKMPKLSITCANAVYHRLSKWCTDRRQSVCST